MSLQDSHQISDVKVLLKKGVDGAGIANIEKTGTSGNVDTYTITLTNGDKYTFTVTNGGGGHEIENAIGQILTQRDKMQFLDGLDAVDDGEGEITKVKMNLPIVPFATWDAMTEEEKTAYIESHYRFGIELPDTEGVINAEYMKLLWENPNTSQAFAAQTITLSSADYDFLLCIASEGSVLVKKGQQIRLSEAATSGGTSVINRMRSANYVSDTSYSFGDAVAQNSGSNRNTDNTLLKPVAIYGIKKDFQFKVNAIASDLSTRADHCFLDDETTTVEDVVTANELQPYINVASYTDSNPYVCPCDGYFSVSCASGSSITGRVRGATSTGTFVIGTTTANVPSVIFVKKGMRISVRSSSGTTYAEFYPLSAE